MERFENAVPFSLIDQQPVTTCENIPVLSKVTENAVSTVPTGSCGKNCRQLPHDSVTETVQASEQCSFKIETVHRIRKRFPVPGFVDEVFLMRDRFLWRQA